MGLEKNLTNFAFVKDFLARAEEESLQIGKDFFSEQESLQIGKDESLQIGKDLFSLTSRCPGRLEQ